VALYFADALILLGLCALTVGVYGVIRMPGTFLKVHASSKAVFLGLSPLLVAAVATGDLAMIYRAVLIATLLLLTTPISAHAITKAAYQRGEAMQASNPADESGRNLPGS
jgi:multicomponent Na+:H+ antiporter subunit G